MVKTIDWGKMHAIWFSFDHLKLFKDGSLKIDLFASDKVPSTDESAFELSKPLYVNTVIALAGINASGKTTALKLINLGINILNHNSVRGIRLPERIADQFDGTTTFRAVGWEDGRLVLVESVLRFDDNDEASGASDVLLFDDETMWSVPLHGITKSMLADWNQLVEKGSLTHSRKADAKRFGHPFPQTFSMANLYNITRSLNDAIVAYEDGVRLASNFDGLDDVLRVFDPSIDHLEVVDEGRAFQLTFGGREPLVLSRQGLEEVLSSGTVRGLALVQAALSALKTGKYLLVDELENHLNRQLVNVVMDLFASRETNPMGATLIFTTHYPQLLDHIHRKDCVFFLVRNTENRTEVAKYSDRVKRIENKKSEVFASNYVKGTAPRYVDVARLRKIAHDVARSWSDE